MKPYTITETAAQHGEQCPANKFQKLPISQRHTKAITFHCAVRWNEMLTSDFLFSKVYSCASLVGETSFLAFSCYQINPEV